jgi:hypothetical protein
MRIRTYLVRLRARPDLREFLGRTSGSSLGTLPPKVQRHLAEAGRDFRAVFYVGRVFAGSLFYFPKGGRGMLFYFMRRAGLLARGSNRADDARARAFNFTLDPWLRYWKREIPGFTRATGGEAQARVVDQYIFAQHEREAERMARRMVDSLKARDLLAFVWEGEKPPVLREIYKQANGTEIDVESVRRGLARHVLPGLTAKYSSSPMVVTPFGEGNLGIALKGGITVELDLEVLMSAGVDPSQVLALLWRIADHPELRNRLLEISGFERNGASSWVAGRRFLQTLFDKVYSEETAKTILAQAA